MNCNISMTMPVVDDCAPLWLSEQATYPANRSSGSDVVQSHVRGQADDHPSPGNAVWFPSAGPR